MGCRKNQASLTPAERAAYVAAVKALKTMPSRITPPTANRYDDYVEIHNRSMTGGAAWAHRRPAFLPWHRAYLREFELDLQSVDSTVTLPYWDWTADSSATSSIWDPDFMGGDGSGAQAKVTTGPFREGQWVLSVGGTTFLQREFGLDVPTLPTAQQVTDCITQETLYDAGPWNDSSSTDGYRNRAEGWTGSGSIHNRVHRWVGGSMQPATSPNDPVFFLHHCNVDRLWARWQREHGYPPYAPTDATAPVVNGIDLVGHRPSDSMLPWGGSTTVASTFNHHSVGYWYDDEAPVVTLPAPSVAFHDVPEGVGGAGVTTFRAAVFELQSCAPVTLEVIAGPTAPFTLTALGSGVVVPAAHGDQPAVGRIWIAYTSTFAGDTSTGSVTIGQTGTTNQWVVTLSANTIARPRSAVALALDRSGSMSDPAGDGTTKVSKLKEAVSVFSDVMRQGDGLGIVSFDDVTARLMDVIDVGPQPPVAGSGRAGAAAILAGTDLDPRGATGIGAAVVEAADALDDAQAVASPPYDVRGLVVLTDGNENVDPRISQVAASINAHTFAIGFGTPGNVSAAALSALSNQTGGYLLVTGALDQDQTYRLSKYFLQILAGLTNTQIVVDPGGDLVLGPTHRIPFTLTEADYGADVILLAPMPEVVEFTLETPDGTIIAPHMAGVEPGISFVTGPGVSYYRMSLPALQSSPGSAHAGEWRALLRLGERRAMAAVTVSRANVGPWAKRGSLPYSVVVHALSSLELHADLVQRSAEPGDPIGLVARLTEYGVPVTKAEIWAEIQSPKGGRFTVKLPQTGDGAYAGGFEPGENGVYTIRVRAAGTTLQGTGFSREVTLTASVQSGGLPDTGVTNQGPIRDFAPPMDLCHLLACLVDRKVTGSLFDELANRFGADRDALERCIRSLCDQRREPQLLMRSVDPARREAARSAGTADARSAPTMVTPAAPTVGPREALPSSGPASLFDRLVEAEPVPRPPQVHEHDDGPMFGLSPEDLAELGRPPERRDPSAGGTGGTMHGPGPGMPPHGDTPAPRKPRATRKKRGDDGV